MKSRIILMYFIFSLVSLSLSSQEDVRERDADIVGFHLGIMINDAVIADADLWEEVSFPYYSFSVGFFEQRDIGYSPFKFRNGIYIQGKGNPDNKYVQLLAPLEVKIEPFKIRSIKLSVFIGTGLEINFWSEETASDAYRIGYNLRAGLDLEYVLNKKYSFHLELLRASSLRAYYERRRFYDSGTFYGYEILLKFSKAKF